MKSNSRRLMWFGGIGAGVTALCCFTPLLVIAFGALGAGAALAYADKVLFPLLAVFLGVMVYGAMKLRASSRAAPPPPDTE